MSEEQNPQEYSTRPSGNNPETDNTRMYQQSGSQKPKLRFGRAVLIFVVPLLIIASVFYVYSNNNKLASSSLTVTDYKDVKDFDTCISYVRNRQIVFDIVFKHDSDFKGVKNFARDFSATYPRATIQITSEIDFLNDAVERNKGSIYTESQVADYKEGIRVQATSKISVQVPVVDLGTQKSFDDFIFKTLKKYPSISFQQYAGSSPENYLDSRSIKADQESGEKQCEKTYKQLTESDRIALKTKNDAALIQTAISGTRVNALWYFGDHNSTYASGSLSLNNGVCSDTGVYGLKKTLDSIAELAGSVYCYASETAYAVSAPLKSTSATGYCTDSTGFYGAVSSPTAASKGYCVAPVEKKTDVSSCKDKATARERWICAGNIVDPFPFRIGNIVGPYARPLEDKIDFCKSLSGIEADYCFSSIIKSVSVTGDMQQGVEICSMVSNQYPWLKKDCTED